MTPPREVSPTCAGFWPSPEEHRQKAPLRGWGGEAPGQFADNRINGCGREGERIPEDQGSAAPQPSHAPGRVDAALPSRGGDPNFSPLLASRSHCSSQRLRHIHVGSKPSGRAGGCGGPSTAPR